VRSSLYSSDYLIIPCTSDTFSEYCIGLIAQMLPQFLDDWHNGLMRFKQNNYGSKDYDRFGQPRYAGWIFNGFDTRSDKMLRADYAHYQNIATANKELANCLISATKGYNPVVAGGGENYNIGRVEDMNIPIQNSLWQNVPVSKLGEYGQVQSLSGNKQKWASDQLKQIGKLRDQTDAIASWIIKYL
jgi:chromosome partitioning protein